MTEWEIIDVSKLEVTPEILERTKIINPILLTHPVPKLFTDLFSVKPEFGEWVEIPEPPS